MRAGREPAEDVKKRMVTACKNAGLTVQGAWMRLQKAYGYRLIRVDAVDCDGPCRRSVIGLSAAVGVDGTVSAISIGCAAGLEDRSECDWNTTVMHGREAVPLDELAEELKQTVTERRIVIDAQQRGDGGPYFFEYTFWASSHDP